MNNIYFLQFIFKIWNYWIFHDLLWYCHTHMSSEIIQIVAYDNYDDFQHGDFIFSQNFISPFWGLFDDEIDLKLHKAILLKYSLWDRYGFISFLAWSIHNFKTFFNDINTYLNSNLGDITLNQRLILQKPLVVYGEIWYRFMNFFGDLINIQNLKKCLK
jgi:hypothetical protein